MKVKTLWISDTHLGTRGCKDKELLSFLKEIRCENLFLVGDIIDGWRLKSSFYWNSVHNEIIKEILKKSKHGVNIIWVAGNHDEFIRPYLDHIDELGGIKFVNEWQYNIGGKTFWITHGDEFDGITRYHKWVAILGDYAYTILLWANRHFNRFRARFNLGYWSLSAYLKHKVKKAVNFIFEYENALARECRNKNYDGVICGHIHQPEIKYINNILYCNDGDWVESCSALIETYENELKIIFWRGNKITHKP